jgi:hypothetical protein
MLPGCCTLLLRLQTRDADRKRDARPSRTLFVVNFDLGRTRERDLERHFEPYGEQVLPVAARDSTPAATQQGLHDQPNESQHLAQCNP